MARSSQSVNTTSKTTEAAATVTVQNNLPNADAGTRPPAARTRQEETTNYEIGKTVRTLIRDQPQIDRISLAVMVDGTRRRRRRQARPGSRVPAEELARITALVKTAIGFDAKRGDQVEVARMRFVTDDAAPAPRRRLVRHWAGPGRLVHLAETGLFGLIGLLALLLVLRPMVLRLTTLARRSACRRRPAPARWRSARLARRRAQSWRPQLASAHGRRAAIAALLEDESMVEHRADRGPAARLVDPAHLAIWPRSTPRRPSSIVRGWMAQEGG